MSHPPSGFVEVAAYDLLVDAGDVVGPLADEMAVWCRGRPVWLASGKAPTDMTDIHIWVAEADAERARALLAKLVPPPPTQDDFEREEPITRSEPRGASAVRRLFVALLVLGAFVALMLGVERCGR